MIRICAWCRQEGKAGFLGTSPQEPREIDQVESHGICPDHGIRLRQSFKRNLLDRPLQQTTLSSLFASFRA